METEKINGAIYGYKSVLAWVEGEDYISKEKLEKFINSQVGAFTLLDISNNIESMEQMDEKKA